MNTATQTARATRETVTPKTTPSRQTAAPQQAAKSRFADIETNTFYKIFMNEESSLEERQAAATTEVAVADKTMARQRSKEAQQYLEWLQDARQQMARKIATMTDTDAYGYLQSVYQDLQGELINFQTNLEPFTQLIDALHQLRLEGKSLAAFKEIVNDRKNEASLDDQEKRLAAEDAALASRLEQIELEILRLSEQKTWGGFGGIKESARVEIAKLEREKEQKRVRRAEIGRERAAIREKRTNSPSELGGLLEQKERLRHLLDLTGDEHRAKQEQLVNDVLRFIDKANASTAEGRNRLEGLSEQMVRLRDAGQHITRLYAVFGESTKDAQAICRERAVEFAGTPEGETLIQQHMRQEAREEIETHIKSLNTISGTVVKTYADLVSESIRVGTMQGTVDEQLHVMRTLQAEGIAGTADRLASTLQMITQAALEQSAAATRDTLAEMVATTNRVSQNQAIANAIGMREQNADIERALDELAQFGTTARDITEMTSASVREAFDHLANLKSMAEEVRVEYGKAQSARAGMDVDPSSPAAEAEVADDTDVSRKIFNY